LSGQSFCFTGKMSKPRKELEQIAEAAGGEIKSVGKGLTFLVQADPSSASSKTKKAEKYGVQIISEEQFMAMV
jgi:DNA ligase (NAD+)